MLRYPWGRYHHIHLKSTVLLDSHDGKAFERTEGIPAPSLTARARDGPITGAGPLPPELGQASGPLHMGAGL